MTTTKYTPRPFREYSPPNHRPAAEIQREIDLMRSMYATRRSLNQPRRDAMVGWCLVGLALAVPAIAAIAILILGTP
jgi:hypothetical protein